MAFDYAVLKEIGYIPDTAADVFQSTAVSYIRTIILHNTNTTAEEVVLYTVPTASDDTFTVAQQWYKQSLVADETIFIEIPAPGLMLTAGDALGAVTDTASKVTIQVFGGTE